MNKTHDEYINEKVVYSFGLMKQNKFFRKARAVIVKDEKIVVLKGSNSSKVFIPGGGIEDGEGLKQAIRREAMEETGAVCRPVKIIGRNYYNVPMEYEGEKFISKRVEFFYLCEFVRYQERESLGIDGEFDETIYVDEVEIKELKHSKLSKKQIALVEEYIQSKKSAVAE